ncbi:MAG: hypothetical protein A2158_02650 [Chloroflexi bacterium RBG_13_46_14]|nr:MAG: hypothetical protein A2158_02650 [Chloroflexi bacterium RBG_13_46_14]
MVHSKTQGLIAALTGLPRVRSVNDIIIKDNFLEQLSFDYKTLGRLEVHRLKVADASELFNFYFTGLSEEARNLFPPYPLFSPPVNSADELAGRIRDWGKEKDWTVFKLVKDDVIIGVCLLKRWETYRPTSGLAVHEEFRNKGLGVLLQTIVNEQAVLLGLKMVYATVAPDNAASLRIHEKCGFKKTKKIVPHYGYKNGVRVMDRNDMELILELKRK